MATPTLAPDEAVAEATVKARRIERRHPEQLVAVAALLAIALFLLPTLLDSYWLQIMNAVTRMGKATPMICVQLTRTPPRS